MEFCPEVLLENPDMKCVWMAAVDPAMAKKEKKYKSINVGQAVQYMRTFLNGERAIFEDAVNTPRLTMYAIRQLCIGVSTILHWRMKDLNENIQKSAKEMRLQMTPPLDLPEPKKKAPRILDEVFREFDEADDFPDIPSPGEVPRPAAGFDIEPPSLHVEGAEITTEMDLEEIPRAGIDFEIPEFPPDPLAHTVPRELITLDEVDPRRPATPPCDHEHQNDPNFESDFSTEGLDLHEPVIPPPLPPIIQDRPVRPARHTLPPINIEEALANLRMLPVDELLRERPQQLPLMPDELFPRVDELAWFVVNDILMPTYPLVARPAAPLPVRRPETPPMPEAVPPPPPPMPETVPTPPPMPEAAPTPPDSVPAIESPRAESPATLDSLPLNDVLRLLRRLVRNSTERPITFAALVPPKIYDRRAAACIFKCLIELDRLGRVRLEQTGPSAPIIINVIDLARLGQSRRSFP